MLTQEVLEHLKEIDEVSLMELLELTSEEIVDRFSDKIEDNLNRIYKYLRDN